jgi:hypothetical protein
VLHRQLPVDMLKFSEKQPNMTQEEFKVIQENAKDVDKIPNSKLEESMDKLATEFEEIKNSIIGLSFYLDKIEELYNKILKEYQTRNGRT